jgi:predicted secreted hydrolase
MSGAQHYEHAGRIEGTISVDGEIYTLNGFGQRDHSWGVRDMRIPANWRWFSGQFKDKLCFNAIKVELLAFRASGGYIYHQGKAEALKGWSFKADFDNSGMGAKSVSLSLLTSSGKRFNVVGEILENIPVRVNTGRHISVVNEARTRFSWNSITGYGISEFMEQISS